MSSQIPDKMKAAYIEDWGKPWKVVDDYPVKKDIGDEEVLLKIEYASWCHTDLQVQEGTYADQCTQENLIGCHEPVGKIVLIGKNGSRNGELKVGDRVGSINTFAPCCRCNGCKQGKQLCEKMTGMLGLTINGGFSEYMVASSTVVRKVPDDISPQEAAPLFCAGATVYGALRASDPKPGQWIAIIGIGGLGHLGVQYAKAQGLKVIAIDNRKEGIDLANDVPSHLRPDKTYVIDSEEARQKCSDELENGLYDTNPGVDRVVINTEANDLIAFAQTFTRKGGIIVDVGLPSDNKFVIQPFALNFKEQTIKGRLICTPEEVSQMLELHSKNKCRTHIEKSYNLDQINEMVEHYKSSALKGRLGIAF